MLRSRIRSIGLLLLATSLLFGCTSKKSETGPTPVGAAATGGGILAAGSTFIYPAMSRWIADYHSQHPNVEINYQSVGSGAGRTRLVAVMKLGRLAARVSPVE